MLFFKLPDRLFERALSFVGKDYLCYPVWDKYIEYEYSQKQWSHLAHIYLRTLRFPTKKLHMYHKRYIQDLLFSFHIISISKISIFKKKKISMIFDLIFQTRLEKWILLACSKWGMIRSLVS